MRMGRRKIRLNPQGKSADPGVVFIICVVLRSSRKDKLFDETIGHLQDILIGECVYCSLCLK